MGDKDDEIAALAEGVQSLSLLNTILERALRTLMLELPRRRQEVLVDITDLEIPEAPLVARFFLNDDDELEME